MDIKINGKNIKITDGMHTKIMESLTKFNKYEILKAGTPCNVMIRTVKSDQIVEITIYLENKKVIRVEKRSKDLYTAIDMAEDALERQVRKYKETIIDKKRIPSVYEKNADEMGEESTSIKEKIIFLEECSTEEALQRMKKFGSNFHLFLNSDTGCIGVVYREKENCCGLITGV
jgi:putative sigma-54 modulation protein